MTSVFVSGSAFGRVSRCPASAEFQVGKNPYRPVSAGAAAGTERHAAIAADLDQVAEYLPAEYRDLLADPPKNFVIEKALKTRARDGVVYGGTADLIIDELDRGRLHVYDWKTGHLDVSSLGFDQLELYAYLYAAQKRIGRKRYPDIQVRLRLVNPDLSETSASYAGLADITQRVESAMDRISAAVRAKEPVFRVGEHCRYCPAAAHCKTIRRALLSYAQPRFRGLAVDEWTEEELELLPIADKMIKAIKDDIKARLEAGLTVNGFYIASAAGARSWAPWVTPEELAERLGGERDGYVTETIASPPQLEKRGVDVSACDDMIVRPPRRTLKYDKKEKLEKEEKTNGKENQKGSKKAAKKAAKKSGRKTN